MIVIENSNSNVAKRGFLKTVIHHHQPMPSISGKLGAMVFLCFFLFHSAADQAQSSPFSTLSTGPVSLLTSYSFSFYLHFGMIFIFVLSLWLRSSFIIILNHMTISSLLMAVTRRWHSGWSFVIYLDSLEKTWCIWDHNLQYENGNQICHCWNHLAGLIANTSWRLLRTHCAWRKSSIGRMIPTSTKWTNWRWTRWSKDEHPVWKESMNP